LPDQREAVKKRSERHLKEVCFCRQCKQEKEIRGAWCWRDPNRIHHIGQGVQHGTPGVWGFGENDGAAQWYCAVPSDGNNKGKYRCPKSTVDMKVIVRVIHGLTILVTLTAPWVSRSSNPDFGCTIVLETFRELEKRTSDGRLPKRWYVTSTTTVTTHHMLLRVEHFDAGDGNWTNTTFLFYCYLVEQDVFDEIIITR
jgi:hypothetical protein